MLSAIVIPVDDAHVHASHSYLPSSVIRTTTRVSEPIFDILDLCYINFAYVHTFSSDRKGSQHKEQLTWFI